MKIKLKQKEIVKRAIISIMIVLSAFMAYGIMIISALVIMFFAEHYNFSSLLIDEKYLLGKTEQQIVDKYGDFDVRADLDGDGILEKGAYYIWDFSGMDNDYCYYIFFDNEGKAKSVKKQTVYYVGG